MTGGEARAPVARVIVEPVVITSNDRVFEAVGTGRARLSVQIYPAVAEEVTDVRFEAQDAVERGDVLVQLDDRQEVLAIELAQVRLNEARRLLDRYETAVKEGGVPQSEVDSARAEFEGAEVALRQARLDLEERKIKAPFDGIIGIPRIDPGDRVDPSTMIANLDDRRVLQVDFEIPEALAGALVGDAATSVSATTPAYPGRTFDASITAQESRIDPERRTLMVRANIVNEDDLLRPGMSFSTRWGIAGNEYPTVPEISLQWGRDGSFIWLVRDGHSQRVPVRVIARAGGRVLVEAEIADGEPVVVEGLQRVRPGEPVEVLGERAS